MQALQKVEEGRQKETEAYLWRGCEKEEEGGWFFKCVLPSVADA